LLKSSDAKYRKRFDEFLQGLRKTLNPSISEDDAIEMLAQHLITKPVFDALFEGYEFTKQNPVSKTMQKMLDLLEEQNLEKETVTLDKFYESVRERARGIDNAQGKQKIIVELYDKFFKTAFPRMAERLGIVYTPVEIVDFIIKSVDDALKSEFGIGLTDKNVHILDPFTGTGTFIVRMLQSDMIADTDLTRKFREELHANEIILLAYYIAAINIE
jgi:predicted helicase